MTTTTRVAGTADQLLCLSSSLEAAKRLSEVVKEQISSSMTSTRIESTLWCTMLIVMRLIQSAGQTEKVLIFYTLDQMIALSRSGIEELLMPTIHQLVSSLGTRRVSQM